jgi:hypothetical protein
MAEEFAFRPVTEKYAMDFGLLLNVPRLLVETNPSRQSYLATEILFNAIASFFKVSEATIHKHCQPSRRGLDGVPGRKPKIPAPSKCQTVAEIAHKFDQGRPVGYEAILDWIYTNDQLVILPDTL